MKHLPWGGTDPSRMPRFSGLFGPDKQIGAVDVTWNTEPIVPILRVFYFGALSEQKAEFSRLFANVSLNCSLPKRAELKPASWGGINDVTLADLYEAKFILQSSFEEPIAISRNWQLWVFFSAERLPPTTYDTELAIDDYDGAMYHANVPEISD